MRDDRDERARADYWEPDPPRVWSPGPQILTAERLERLRRSIADPQGPWQRAQQAKQRHLESDGPQG